MSVANCVTSPTSGSALREANGERTISDGSIAEMVNAGAVDAERTPTDRNAPTTGPQSVLVPDAAEVNAKRCEERLFQYILQSG